ncbi:MAG TPA: hypothetical protein VI076_14090 [Actinopolymorphaceae bacterium]
MPVTDDQYMTVRTLLEGDAERHRYLYEQFDLDADRSGYAALVDATFTMLVERAFSKDDAPKQVAEFVKQSAKNDDLDAELAEKIMLSVFDGSNAGGDEDTVLSTKVALLGALIADKPLNDSDLGVFLFNARSKADQAAG